jgi:outer membrane protein OmpA-like peptidoglycan-associated protein
MNRKRIADRGWRIARAATVSQFQRLWTICYPLSAIRFFLLACIALSWLPATGVRADQRAAAAAPTVKRFIACPVYRDTNAGRKSGCWLATDPADGVQYDVTGGRIKPILGHRILVEGAVTRDGGEMCGGVVLEPVSVSVLPDDCKEYLIPAEGHSGRRFVLPTEVMQPTSVARQLPPPPYEPRTFTVLFELNSDFLVYQYAELIIEKAVLYTRASKPRRVTITGYADTRGAEVSGERIREERAIGEARARMVAEAFTRLGVQRELMDIKWTDKPAKADPPTDGLTEAAKRRVEIRIEP